MYNYLKLVLIKFYTNVRFYIFSVLLQLLLFSCIYNNLRNFYTYSTYIIYILSIWTICSLIFYILHLFFNTAYLIFPINKYNPKPIINQ